MPAQGAPGAVTRPPFPAHEEEAARWGKNEAVKEGIKLQEMQTQKLDETVHQGHSYFI